MNAAFFGEDRPSSMFFGDCDTRDKAIARFREFTGCLCSAVELVEAYEEMQRKGISKYVLNRISKWIN